MINDFKGFILNIKQDKDYFMEIFVLLFCCCFFLFFLISSDMILSVKLMNLPFQKKVAFSSFSSWTIEVNTNNLHCFVSVCRHQNIFLYFFACTAMGIRSSIQQCCRKCCPMLVLQQQKGCKGFHMHMVFLFTWSFFSGFTVLLIIPERFNLV